MKTKNATEQKGIDRRGFLKQFAVTSVLIMQTAVGCTDTDPGCGSVGPGCGVDDPVPLYGPITVAEYGPAPVPEYGAIYINDNTTVAEMFFLLEDESKASLYDAKEVSVDAQFGIAFSTPMTPSSRQAVVLQDDGDQPVDLQFQWNSEQTLLTITPAAPLNYGATYTLLVEETAQDAYGGAIEITEKAHAVFSTTAA